MTKKNEATIESTIEATTAVEAPKTYDVAALMTELKTKSAVIRYLHGEGLTKGAIAKALDIRYQHVRNVLITPIKKA